MQPLAVNYLDPVTYNVNLHVGNQPTSILLPTNAVAVAEFVAPERLSARVRCSIHPWMGGWLMIKDHLYMAVSDDNGRFEIKNLPAGTWAFQIWHEKAGYLDNVTLNGNATEWERGRVELIIEDKATLNLGDVGVPATAFE